MSAALAMMSPRPPPSAPAPSAGPPHEDPEIAPEESQRPSWPILVGGTVAIAALSFATLGLPSASASTLLGALMLAGAEIDARTFLLPDLVTGATFAAGVLAAALLEPSDPLLAINFAVLRGVVTAAVLLVLRFAYARLRGRQGLGLGDVKLAAGIGAWLPAEAIPLCFALAAISALLLVLFARTRGRALAATSRIPFGAFLCPALWITFYVGVWGS
jgi:leader peptidase (prepilin peptidase)/N-methyltransferase